MAAKARLYVDSSAYLGVLAGSGPAAGMEAELRRAILLSSVVFVLEVQRNLVRWAREKVLTSAQYTELSDRFRQDLAGFTLRDVTLDLCAATSMPAAMLPRSLDLLHLRTAQWFHVQRPITRFVSLDKAQNQAARDLGLPV